ncbi:uncharacterized protein LOC143023994 [Oratosquilla oratoria]|uniref:uncharacterized protein LOC143023994 n=1 Tax=Oratosquilla oratoria TaxID=337810 RepID=UPI003F76D738
MSSPRKNLSLLLLLLVVVEGQASPLPNVYKDLARFIWRVPRLVKEKMTELIDEFCSNTFDSSTEPRKYCLRNLPICHDAGDLQECVESSEIVPKPPRLKPSQLFFELLRAPISCYMENKNLIIKDNGSVTINAEEFKAWIAKANDDGIKNATDYCVDGKDNPVAIMRCLVRECIEATYATV